MTSAQQIISNVGLIYAVHIKSIRHRRHRRRRRHCRRRRLCKSRHLLICFLIKLVRAG